VRCDPTTTSTGLSKAFKNLVEGLQIGTLNPSTGYTPKGDPTMKTGLTLTQMAAKVEAQIDQKRDYVVESHAITMNDSGNELIMMAGNEMLEFQVSDTVHRQLAQATGIHGQYYRKMVQEAPELIPVNVNHWLRRQGNRTHVLRTLGSTARALLGGGYEIIDHEQVVAALLQELEKLNGNLEVLSTEVTDRKLYVKLAFPSIEGEVKRGDIIRSGVTICNSETGEGGLNVYPANYRLICTNGMTRMEQGERRSIRHSGSKNREIGEILDSDRAAAKVRQFIDNFSMALDETAFQKTIDQMKQSARMQVEVSADELMERARKHFGLTQSEQVQALNHLLYDEDLTAYGLMNAITRTAHDPESYDRASDLEAMGSRVLNLSSNEWRELALAQ
jgi:hypothetical protein